MQKKLVKVSDSANWNLLKILCSHGGSACSYYIAVSVIFRPHGRRTSSNFGYFPSLFLTQTIYTVIHVTQRVKNMTGETDVTDITAKG